MKKGDQVKLNVKVSERGNFPLMVVAGIDGESKIASCVWFDKKWELRDARIDIDLLTSV
jgi:hypothetical protein